MPRPTLKIVGSQRDALYEQVRNHLAGLGDVVVALECQILKMWQGPGEGLSPGGAVFVLDHDYRRLPTGR